MRTRWFEKALAPVSRPEEWLVILLFLACGFLFYADTLSYWFLIDDPNAVSFAASSLQEIFLGTSYDARFYTPLVGLSLKPDVLLFGMNPFPYRVHNVIVLVLIAFMIYRILRLRVSPGVSCAAALMVLISAPSVPCVVFITLRQYLYPMLFSLIAIYLFIRYSPSFRTSPALVFLIAALAELSFMGKEQFMTLPFVLFILAEGGLRARAGKTFPFFAILILHFFLRMAVLGGLGGYPSLTFSSLLLVKTAFASLLTESKILFGSPWALVFVAAPALFRPAYGLRAVLIWTSSLLVSFLVMGSSPSHAEDYRYWFVATVLFCFFTGLNAALITNRSARIAFVASLWVMCSYTALTGGSELKAVFRREATTAKHIAEIITEKRYENSLFVYAPTGQLPLRCYHLSIKTAFQKVEGITSFFGTFYPSEIVASYPSLLDDFSAVYAVRETGIEPVSGNRSAMLQLFSSGLIQERPVLRLAREGTGDVLSWHCSRTWPIAVFQISREHNDYAIRKMILPYSERIDLSAYGEHHHLRQLPIGSLAYRRGKWIVGDKELPDGIVVATCSCSEPRGQFTLLSDLLTWDMITSNNS